MLSATSRDFPRTFLSRQEDLEKSQILENLWLLLTSTSKKSRQILQVTTDSLTSFYWIHWRERVFLHGHSSHAVFNGLLSLRLKWNVLRFLLFRPNAAIASVAIFFNPAFRAMHPIVVFSCCTTSTTTHLNIHPILIMSHFEWLYQVPFSASVRDRQSHSSLFCSWSHNVGNFSCTHLYIQSNLSA